MKRVSKLEVYGNWRAVGSRGQKAFERDVARYCFSRAKEWYIHQFEPASVELIHHWDGPEWTTFTDGHHTIKDAVELIRQEGLRNQVPGETPKIHDIWALKERIPFDDTLEKVVLLEEDGKLVTKDGNHRAAATILDHLEEGEDHNITAFVGRSQMDQDRFLRTFGGDSRYTEHSYI